MPGAEKTDGTAETEGKKLKPWDDGSKRVRKKLRKLSGILLPVFLSHTLMNTFLKNFHLPCMESSIKEKAREK